MRHVSLTCKNHPDLRWSTKEIAFTDEGGYNGSRNLSFKGRIIGAVEFYSDMSGIRCQEPYCKECDCPSDCLIRAPEDKQLEEAYNKWLEEWHNRMNNRDDSSQP